MILVFGKTGMVSGALADTQGVTALGRDAADLSNPEACAEAILDAQPSAVINAAAYTAVDKAESEEDLATRINGAAPGAMARACADLGIPLVHISTDYVFAGGGSEPWNPADPVAPPNAYGRSKLVGEEAIRDSGATHAILRTSWVFSARGNNFVKTMLRLGAERDRLTIVDDQTGGPTWALDIAKACLDIAGQLIDDPAKSGTYHYSGGPDVTWAEFARAIFSGAGLSPEVVGIPTSDFPTPATRPANSRMNNSAVTEIFGIARPDWRAGLAHVLRDLK